MADSDTSPPSVSGPKKTLGLTGLTINAMALIAPGAFLWLTFAPQAQTGAPMAGSGMWFGIVVALALCMATAIAYAELAKLYPGAGSSYFFAEQAFLSKTHAFRFARVAKFITGWASHLYYWVYPGVMVGVTAILSAYLLAQIFPNTFNPAIGSPLFMFVFCIVFAFGVAYIAFRGVTGTTGVNLAINVIQITALLIFSVMAFSYRMKHVEGAVAFTMDPDGNPTDKVIANFKADNDGNPVAWKVDDKGVPLTFKADDKGALVKDAKGELTPDPKGVPAPDEKGKFVYDDGGKPMHGEIAKDGTITKDDKKDWIVALDKDGKEQSFTISYKDPVTKVPADAAKPDGDKVDTFQYHAEASSVVAPHNFSYAIIQACVAILILVGFESVTSMGEEALDAKRDIPRAVILSLAIQGGFCYLIEYFAANYFLNNGYPMTTAAGSSAPIGDMMYIIGTYYFGSVNAGWWFMMIQAGTVFLALIGTTLSCLSTGARVTYAMGRDEEVPSHFGLLHGKLLTPHRAIWSLAALSAIIGIVCCAFYLCGPAATAGLDTALTDAQKAGPWYKFGVFSYATAQKFPNSLLAMGLASNFGTFVLYMITCLIAMVAFKEHHSFNGFKHMVVPIFGLVANLLCMLFYLIGPFMVAGMSWKEPYCALGLAAFWGIYGAIYFMSSSKAKGKSVMIESKPAASGA